MAVLGSEKGTCLIVEASIELREDGPADVAGGQHLAPEQRVGVWLLHPERVAGRDKLHTC